MVKKLNVIGYILIIITLLTAFVYYHFDSHVPHTNELLSNPQSYSGTYKGPKQVMGPYAGSFEKGFYLEYNQQLLPVHYDKRYTAPRYGEVLVYGTFERGECTDTCSENYLQARAVHNHNYNYIIYLISSITGIFVMVFFFSEWELTEKGFRSKETKQMTRSRKTKQRGEDSQNA